jgi:hypothetical protein
MLFLGKQDAPFLFNVTQVNYAANYKGTLKTIFIEENEF